MLKSDGRNDTPKTHDVRADDLRKTVNACGFNRLIDDPKTPEDCRKLLQKLFGIGQTNLSMARLVEGHVDAVQIVARYGTDVQREHLGKALANGALLGVWNAPHSEFSLRIEKSELNGAKSYASGAGIITHALVTAEAGGASPQLILLDLERDVPTLDREFWCPIGMKPTATYQVFWDRVPVDPIQWVGEAGVYESEPWFSAGALRFVAAQAGAITAIIQETLRHLENRDRTSNPFQQERLATMLFLQRSVIASLENASDRIEGDVGQLLAEVALARCTAYRFGDEILKLAQQCVGLQGLMENHPLSEKIADLMVYLRQPGPDAQTVKTAQALADGSLEPGWV